MWVRLSTVVNGNIEFGDPNAPSNTKLGGVEGSGGNIKGTWVTATSAATFTVQHNLGRPARGWIVFDKSASCDVWRAPTQPANQNTQLNLDANAVGVQLKIFVI